MKDLTTKWTRLLGGKRHAEIPKGFKTIEQIAAEVGLSDRQTGKRLRDLLAAKKITRIQGRNENGRVCWFYGVK
jgi:DNA-binding Lrp family transcriptional regulator